MIIFPGETVLPETVTPDNPEGIYVIRATGDYTYDRILLARAAGISVPDSDLWISHHITYDPETNTMEMQFVDALYHRHSHFGGAGAFEKITGYKYGSIGAMQVAKDKNMEYLLKILKSML